MPTTNFSAVKIGLSDFIAMAMLELRGAPATLSTIMALLEKRGLHPGKAAVVKAIRRDKHRFKWQERNQYILSLMNGSDP